MVRNAVASEMSSVCDPVWPSGGFTAARLNENVDLLFVVILSSLTFLNWW